VVHQDAPHDASGDGKEVRAIVPCHLFRIDQTEIRLVDERRGLQAVIRTLVPDVSLRDSMELCVHERNQSLQGILVALSPFDKQPGDFRGMVWNVMSLGPFQLLEAFRCISRYMNGSSHDMTNRTRTSADWVDRVTPMKRFAAILFLTLAGASCGEHRSVPPSVTAPSPIAPSALTAPPGGSLFMRGTVSDTAFRSLAGARVEVVDGPQAGLSTTSDARGEFSLTGLFDDATRFRATKEGYVTATRTLQPFCAACNPNWWINFSLEVPAAPVNVAGDYTLTFVADSGCGTLPDEVRTRTYTATIAPASNTGPANASFPLKVSGALEGAGTGGLGMGVAGDYVAIWLEFLVEQIAPNTFLSFGGLAAASIGTTTGSTIALPFDGTIDYCVTKSDVGRYEECYKGLATHKQCASSNHQLILTRR
jgi:hypothetical protein